MPPGAGVSGGAALATDGSAAGTAGGAAVGVGEDTARGVGVDAGRSAFAHATIPQATTLAATHAAVLIVALPPRAYNRGRGEGT